MIPYWAKCKIFFSSLKLIWKYRIVYICSQQWTASLIWHLQHCREMKDLRQRDCRKQRGPKVVQVNHQLGWSYLILEQWLLIQQSLNDCQAAKKNRVTGSKVWRLWSKKERLKMLLKVTKERKKNVPINRAAFIH